MPTVKDMWERVQEMFRSPSEFEIWVMSRNPQNEADLELLYRQWTYKQFRDSY